MSVRSQPQVSLDAREFRNLELGSEVRHDATWRRRARGRQRRRVSRSPRAWGRPTARLLPTWARRRAWWERSPASRCSDTGSTARWGPHALVHAGGCGARDGRRIRQLLPAGPRQGEEAMRYQAWRSPWSPRRSRSPPSPASTAAARSSARPSPAWPGSSPWAPWAASPGVAGGGCSRRSRSWRSASWSGSCWWPWARSSSSATGESVPASSWRSSCRTSSSPASRARTSSAWAGARGKSA